MYYNFNELIMMMQCILSVVWCSMFLLVVWRAVDISLSVLGMKFRKIFLSVFGVWICGSTQVSTTFWSRGPRGEWCTLCALDSTGHTLKKNVIEMA